MSVPNSEHETEIPFEAAEALRLVSVFFMEEWPKARLQDVQLERVKGGLTNRLHLLRWRNATVTEPDTVLIRHFGINGDRQQQPFDSSATLSSTQQAIVYTEMASRGWGPKIYGIFPGGRLEEWIDAHPLTAEESMNVSIRRDVARSYARLHSLQLPFRKDNFQLVLSELNRGLYNNSSEAVEFLLGLKFPEATECANVFRHTDWCCELAWTTDLLHNHDCKATLTLWDTNYLNVLVKNYESECMTMLIDYETTTYSFRGIDIGGHFTERMYDLSLPASKLTGHSMPDIEEQRTFCKAYLQEMQALGQKMTATDTVDHILLEAKIGSLYGLLSVIVMGLTVDDTESDPFFLSGLVHMMETYHNLKREFMRVYPNDTI